MGVGGASGLPRKAARFGRALGPSTSKLEFGDPNKVDTAMFSEGTGVPLTRFCFDVGTLFLRVFCDRFAVFWGPHFSDVVGHLVPTITM